MSSVHTLIIAKCFLKDMRKLTKQNQKRVRKALEEIRLDPFSGRKVVAAATGKYRYRVGNLRVRYDVVRRDVHILRVIKREDVYRKL